MWRKFKIATYLLRRHILFCHNNNRNDFSFTNNATFNLKYLINDTFWKTEDGPIFFYTGNEGPVETFAEHNGFMFNIAPSFNALLVFAEHRYYGESLPFGDDSFNSFNKLGYLTSSQALADNVNLINYLKNGKNIPVVAFGGSYGGMLASWLRMKYPATVIGAIAASAPIWAFQDLTPCDDFLKIVTKSYKNDNIYYLLSNIYYKLRFTGSLRTNLFLRNIGASDGGKAWLSEAWKLCTPLETSRDFNKLVGWYLTSLVYLAMSDYPYSSSFLVLLPAFPVRSFCTKLTSRDIVDDKNLIIALSDALEVYTNLTKRTRCIEINTEQWKLGGKAWLFQVCTELITPKCSSDKDMFQNFDWDYKGFSSYYFNLWGVNQTNSRFAILEYGGKDLKAASNIVFSNGLLDPCSSGGVLSNISSSVVSVIIPERAHHLDF